VPRSCPAEARATRRRAHQRGAFFLALVHVVACGADAPHEADEREDAAQDGPSPLYTEVESILERSCAFERCHSGAIVGGALDLSRGSDYHAALVGIAACEYERMARVEPGDPDDSWLMVKLTADFRGPEDPYPFYIRFTPASDWDPMRRACRDQTDDGTPLFGQRMPLTAPNMLPERELAAIGAWIDAGAPR
jgi:hypothetical protein